MKSIILKKTTKLPKKDAETGRIFSQLPPVFDLNVAQTNAAKQTITYASILAVTILLDNPRRSRSSGPEFCTCKTYLKS